MKIHLMGLGKMGANLALNLMDHKYDVLGFDISKDARELAKKSGIKVAESMNEFLSRKNNERIQLFLFIPNQFVDDVIQQLMPYLKHDDILVDGGNSNYKLSLKRYYELKEKGIHFVDMGTSGGTHGARFGACLMIGGEKDIYEYLKPVYEAISEKDGYEYMGAPGAGHFVKMVHNGIEYGMMQAIAEGLELMEASNFDIDYEKVTKVWNHGSIIESNLVGYVHEAFKKNARLDEIAGRIDDSGEGRWMIEEALNLGVSMPVISNSLFVRYKSRDDLKFGEKVVAAMRNEFGGHKVYKKK